jgi:hypothetical protein
MKTKLLLLLFVLVASTYSVQSATSKWDGTTRTVWAGGEGTQEDPILIESATNLAYMASDAAREGFGTYLNLHFKLTTDIDLNDQLWTPIDIFIGNFDGNGHKIKGLKMIGTDDEGTGLFRQVNGSGTVKNLGIESGNIDGLKFVGGIAGSVNEGGTIDKCYNKATITGTQMVGGIVGQLSGGTVSNSYNKGTITGNASVGGVVGRYFWQVCSLSNSYNAGVIVGNPAIGYVGSVVGTFADALKPASVVSNNYYDFDVNYDSSLLGIGVEGNPTGVDVFNSPGSTEDGVPPKTVSVTQRSTSQMKSTDMITDLGSAYESDSKNINGGYPVLTWENLPPTGLVYNKFVDFQITKVNNGISISADDFEHITLSVYSITGVEIITKSLKNAEHIRLTSGIYIIKLTRGSQKFVQKIQVF